MRPTRVRFGRVLSALQGLWSLSHKAGSGGHSKGFKQWLSQLCKAQNGKALDVGRPMQGCCGGAEVSCWVAEVGTLAGGGN